MNEVTARGREIWFPMLGDLNLDSFDFSPAAAETYGLGSMVLGPQS